jgi:heat shock protein HtpX
MPAATLGLSTQIYNNHLKSAILLAGFPFLLLLMMGSFFAGMDALTQSAAAQTVHSGASIDWHRALNVGLDNVMHSGHWAILAAGLWFVIAYFFHGNMMRMASGSVPITRAQMPKLYNMLENLCISRGIPIPQFEIIDTSALNAFATGIDQKSYRIVLTQGLIDTLPDDELEAVIGHELTHIMSRDVRLLIISVIFVGMISFFCHMVFRMLVNGGRSSRRENKNSGILLLLALVILAVGYVFAIVIRFALSRRREYLADAGSVELTKNPEAMMRALLRISGHDAIPGMPGDIQQMCIENSQNFMGIFSTHPSVEDRIRTISAMTGAVIPQTVT